MYDKLWLKTNAQRLIDPDIQFYSGQQFPNKKENFGIFLDSMPDTWGRTLMKRREAQFAKINETKANVLDHTKELLKHLTLTSKNPEEVAVVTKVWEEFKRFSRREAPPLELDYTK